MSKYFQVTATVKIDVIEYQLKAEDEQDAEKKFLEIINSEFGLNVQGNSLIERYKIEYLDADELEEDEIDLDFMNEDELNEWNEEH